MFWRRSDENQKIFGPYSIWRERAPDGSYRYLMFKKHTRIHGTTECLGCFSSGIEAERYIEQYAGLHGAQT